MSDTVKINPELVAQAGAVQRSVADELQGPLSVQAQLEAQINAHGPIFAEFKEAMSQVVLPGRHADITDQITTNEELGKLIQREAGNFAAREQTNAQHQASIEP